MDEQRKVVTALFCDLVGSTELSGILEPETLRMVVLRYFEAMRRRIEAYGGTVEKFIGDAVMAVFGVPAVHEDDAHRAAAAALEMLAALEELNTELEDDLGCRLAVRIGVNTGEVVAASGGSLSGSLVSGEVVNVAARLEQHAGPGRILVGPLTRELLGTAARVEPVGALALKGKRDPVPAFRLLGLSREGADRSGRSDTPFVGRERELARFAELWGEVCAGGGCRAVAVSGDAGIGKTRLVREWLAALPAGQVQVGAGRCHPYRDEASLAPLAAAVGQLLEGAAGGGSPDGPALRVLRAGLLDGGTPSPTVEDTYLALAAVLGELAASRPVVLVLDDLQWARPMLREGADRLVRALRGARVLLVRIGRPVPAGDDTGPGTVAVPLAPLSAADSRRLAAHLTRHRTVSDAGPPTAVVDRAEGNPLYLEQLLAMLEDGARPDDLPATVTAVLTARIDALGPAERTVLDACALLGRQFDPAGIQPLIDAPEPGAGPREGAAGGPVSLGGLVDRGLLEPVPGPGNRHRFSSGLVRDVTYHGISKRRRAHWHEHLATVPGAGPAVTGHHAEQAYLHRGGLGLRGPHTERLRRTAARALTDVGRTALARADLSWSDDLHGRALALSTPDDPWWTVTAQGLGETRLALGRIHEGGELLVSVLAAADAAGDRLSRAHARLQLAGLENGGVPGSAADAARAGLPAFEAAGDRLGLARAHVRLAQEQQFLGHHGAAAELLAAALHHAVAAGAAPERAMVLGAFGISLWQGPTPAAAAVRRCRELLAAPGGGHATVLVTVNYPLANLLALQGDFAAARHCLAVADRLVAGLEYAEAAAFAPLFRAGVEVLAGEPEEAERLLRESVRQCRTTGGPGLLAAASRDLARVRLGLGEPPDLEWVDGGGPVAAGDRADLLGIRALAEAAAGRTGPAVALARRAVAAAADTDSPVGRATAEWDLARTCRAAGLPVEAGLAADRAARWFLEKGHAVGRDAVLAFSAAADRGGR